MAIDQNDLLEDNAPLKFTVPVGGLIEQPVSEKVTDVDILQGSSDEAVKTNSNETLLNHSGEPKKNKIDRNTKRFNEARYKVKVFEEENIQLKAKLIEAQRALQEKERLIEHEKQISDENYQASVKLSEANLIEKIKEARLIGDFDAEITYQNRLNKLIADESTHQLYRHQQKLEKQKELTESPQESDIVEYPVGASAYDQYDSDNDDYDDSEHDSIFEDWLARNRWANPNDPLYNEELLNEASLYDKHKRKQLALKGQELNYAQHLDEIANAVKSVYLQNQSVSENPTQPRQNMYNRESRNMSSPHVAAVPRNNITDSYASNERRGGQERHLTQDQTDALQQLIANDPSNKQKIVKDFLESIEQVNRSLQTSERSMFRLPG